MIQIFIWENFNRNISKYVVILMPILQAPYFIFQKKNPIEFKF